MIIKEYIIVAIAIVGGIYLAYATYPSDRRLIDCSIAEISPDYSNDMKEACRKARMAK
jgi:hypothetical protein